MRIALHDASPLGTGMTTRGFEQALGQAPATMLLFDEEARDRPDFLLVHRLEDSGTRERGILFARSDRAPSDGLVSREGEDAGLTLLVVVVRHDWSHRIDGSAFEQQ